MKLKSIERWFNKIKHVLFKYKDGFFELPILANTPETIISSITKMPFVYHKPQQQLFGTNNPFIKADVFYHQVEDGFWFIYSVSEYKKNINYINQIDTSVQERYYVIFTEINENKIHSKQPILNGISFSHCNWVISKPLVNATNCRFRGNRTTSFGFFIREDWILKNLKGNGFLAKTDLKFFLDTSEKLIIRNEQIAVVQTFNKKLFKLFTKQQNKPIDTQEWDKEILALFDLFLERIKSDPSSKHLLQMTDADRKRLQRVENSLIEHIHKGFPGVEELAQQVGISKNKLMSLFKEVYEVSLFDYFRNLQMDAAFDVVKNSEMSISAIAQSFGYSNASKFSLAFEKVIGKLPSEIRKGISWFFVKKFSQMCYRAIAYQ